MNQKDTMVEQYMNMGNKNRISKATAKYTYTT